MEADGFHLGMVLRCSRAVHMDSGTPKLREMQKPRCNF